MSELTTVRLQTIVQLFDCMYLYIWSNNCLITNYYATVWLYGLYIWSNNCLITNYYTTVWLCGAKCPMDNCLIANYCTTVQLHTAKCPMDNCYYSLFYNCLTICVYISEVTTVWLQTIIQLFDCIWQYVWFNNRSITNYCTTDWLYGAICLN